MAGRRNRKDVDAEVDIHGLTAEHLRMTLQQWWPHWRNLRSVRIVHGQGTVLKPEIIRWCAEMGLSYLPDSHNAGAITVFPQQRTLPDVALGNTLRDSGLRLTAEQEAYLRDPAEAERARQAERRRALIEERRTQALEASQTAQKSRDDALWKAELGRLGVLEKRLDKKQGNADGGKPRPPVIIPRVQLKFEEGYWRAELSRVAETDTETLQVQKRTGLDALAPPMKEEEPRVRTDAGRGAARPPQRDAEAERALFEAEMERLGGFDGVEIRRAKRE